MRARPLLSRGETSEVRAWARTEVIKLFNADVRQRAIEYEAMAASEAHRARIPTPMVSDIVEHEGKNGIVFERIDGQTLSAITRRRPWCLTGSLGREFAHLHVWMHERESNRLRSQDVFMRRMVLNAPNLTPELKSRYLEVLDEAKSSNPDVICHNDFHFGNIICADRGLVVVDWARAARGSPLIDAATTAFKLGRAIRYAGRGSLLHRIASRFGSWFSNSYRRHYLEARRGDCDILQRLGPIVSAAYQTEHVIDRHELATTMRAVYERTGISGLQEWITETINRGHASEEHVNKYAFRILYKDHPDVSLEYAHRALSINPEDRKLVDSLDRLRDKALV